jgi:hypothetical protein
VVSPAVGGFGAAEVASHSYRARHLANTTKRLAGLRRQLSSGSGTSWPGRARARVVEGRGPLQPPPPLLPVRLGVGLSPAVVSPGAGAAAVGAGDAGAAAGAAAEAGALPQARARPAQAPPPRLRRASGRQLSRRPQRRRRSS